MPIEMTCTQARANLAARCDAVTVRKTGGLLPVVFPRFNGHSGIGPGVQSVVT